MAITTADSQPLRSGWIANGNTADLSGAETLRAAPGAGNELVLEKIVISSGAAITVTIGAGETGGAVTTVIYGPVHMAANSQHTVNFERGVVLAANTALVADASGAGNVTILAEGYTQ